MIKFISPYKGLQLTMKPASKSLIDGRIYADTGRHIVFKNGEFGTDNKEEIEYIRNHKRFNVNIFEIKEEKFKVTLDEGAVEDSVPGPVVEATSAPVETVKTVKGGKPPKK